jgi:hypothetical protein
MGESMKPCKHCDMDSHHHGPPRDSVIQLRGVDLCQYHYDTAETVRGHLLSPDTAREFRNRLQPGEDVVVDIEDEDLIEKFMAWTMENGVIATGSVGGRKHYRAAFDPEHRDGIRSFFEQHA